MSVLVCRCLSTYSPIGLNGVGPFSEILKPFTGKNFRPMTPAQNFDAKFRIACSQRGRNHSGTTNFISRCRTA